VFIFISGLGLITVVKIKTEAARKAEEQAIIDEHAVREQLIDELIVGTENGSFRWQRQPSFIHTQTTDYRLELHNARYDISVPNDFDRDYESIGFKAYDIEPGLMLYNRTHTGYISIAPKPTDYPFELRFRQKILKLVQTIEEKDQP